MSLTRSQRLLVLAFAISLLLHLVFAFVVHPWRNRRDNEVEAVSIQHRPLVMSRLQTPPPRPKSTPAPHPQPSIRPAPVRAHGAQPQAGGPGSGATSAPAERPSPAATLAANACEKSDLGAAVAENPPQPDIPNAARAEGTSGVATVNVQLDAQGAVTAANVTESSGNSSLDVVALGMARDARYSPALHGCKPVASAYAFRVRFFAW